MSKRQIIALVLLLLLAPLQWVLYKWPPLRDWINEQFPAQAEHAAGHILIYSGLGIFLVVMFEGLQRRWWLYLGAILLISLCHEVIQSMTKAAPDVRDSLVDSLFNLIGALLAYLVVRLYTRWRAERKAK